MVEVAIGITGVAGRMGLALVRRIVQMPGCRLAGGVDRKDSPAQGRDIGELAGFGSCGILVGDDALPLFAGVDVVIDFTSPSALKMHTDLAAQSKTALVVGTTGLEEAHLAMLTQAAKHVAIVQSFNMSLGVNLLAGMVRQAAAQLNEEWDIEILEMHHRMKVDSPSGTALLLGEAAAKGRGRNLAEIADRGRDGLCGPRRAGEIGFASLRGGNVVGDHTVIFAADDERIEISHKASDRGLFARGAVQAALWVKGRKPGLYRMSDVLGFSS